MSEQTPRPNRFTRARETVVRTATRDVGTPLWFTILMAILTVMITIAIIGLFITNSKVKKGAGYKGSTSTCGGT